MAIRGLDHLVLPCRDLAASAARYADLGFTVGRRNQHPWGTENHIVQFDGAFLELIALSPDRPPPPLEDEAFPFAGFLAGLGPSRDPSGMIVLRAADADADARAFSADGIGEGRMLHFSRTAATPDGGSRTVSFSLAFATAMSMPDIGFFTCQQHTPENFWNPAFQIHPNGATGIAAVTIAAPRSAEHAAFLLAFAGAAPEATPEGVRLDLGNARLDLIDPAAAHPFGAASTVATPRLLAIRFAGRPTTPFDIVADGLVLALG